MVGLRIPALAQGQHPTVADNFQSGIPHSGGMLLSQGQEDTLALFAATLTQGDIRSNSGEMTQDFEEVIRSSFSDLQFNEFKTIMTLGSGTLRTLVLARSMAVVANDGADLLRGHLQTRMEFLQLRSHGWCT